jgi:hypothetical protein
MAVELDVFWKDVALAQVWTRPNVYSERQRNHLKPVPWPIFERSTPRIQV